MFKSHIFRSTLVNFHFVMFVLKLKNVNFLQKVFQYKTLTNLGPNKLINLSFFSLQLSQFYANYKHWNEKSLKLRKEWGQSQKSFAAQKKDVA